MNVTRNGIVYLIESHTPSFREQQNDSMKRWSPYTSSQSFFAHHSHLLCMPYAFHSKWQAYRYVQQNNFVVVLLSQEANDLNRNSYAIKYVSQNYFFLQKKSQITHTYKLFEDFFFSVNHCCCYFFYVLPFIHMNVKRCQWLLLLLFKMMYSIGISEMNE